jgi:CO/xanthine dehydrogenase FAD-binding subunit
MDLPTIRAVASPRTRADLPPWREGAALLGGGTWLFSEPQPHLTSLVDLLALGWPALEPSDAGLRIGATCTIAALDAFAAPADWRAAPLFAACCRALLGSFKVWNTATVGGNVCLALPAAPMLALTVALDGAALIWRRGAGEATTPMAGFALGPQRTILAPGEVLRAIDIPAASLRRRAAIRGASLQDMGRSAALLIATRADDGAATLTITASTARPVHARWPCPPTAAAIDAHIQAIDPALWFDDVHGAPAWRRHMTCRLAAELHADLLS